MASTFAQASPGVVVGRGQPNSFGKGWEYSRTGNPTRGALERALAACEKGRFAVCYSSGMAATTAVTHLLKQGDHVLCIDDVYGGTQRYFRQTVHPTYGIDFDFTDLGDLKKVEKLLRPGQTKLIWVESPTNPTLKVTDIRAVAAFAKKHELLLVVDNTFMSPYFQNPLTLGADIVLHSITKYINGHSDVVGGVVVTNSEDINTKLRFIQNGIGAVPAPFDWYMALRGLKTLHVYYPGLKSHPQHEIAKNQASGFGGMVTFYVRGGLEKARAFLENLELFAGREPWRRRVAGRVARHHDARLRAPEVRKEIGISDNLIRLSVGIEGLPDIIADLERALAAEPKASS
ncbi:Cystathionine gamma-lyase [Phytophthora cinnamomi]|uniref:Cystathionine gamma-lyase n=1 Tax=Phytophthora cinnamomi TaxID=4785 RepID=UPI00355AA73E|nr:Cystathionine gamma-lyase [Phytophthora cinnamomi]